MFHLTLPPQKTKKDQVQERLDLSTAFGVLGSFRDRDWWSRWFLTFLGWGSLFMRRFFRNILNGLKDYFVLRIPLGENKNDLFGMAE